MIPACVHIQKVHTVKGWQFLDLFCEQVKIFHPADRNINITFDLAWKVMKDILIEYYAITGFVAGSPREVLREAYKAELISDEEWMEMLKVRNELTHDYDGEVVKTYCDRIVERYIDLFYDFENTVKKLPEIL